MSRYEELRCAVKAASETLRATDEVATEIAHLLRDRLRQVTSTETLRRFKRELRDFDMTTGRWNR